MGSSLRGFDDAGGGRRGLRATLTPAVVEALMRGYGVAPTGAPQDLGGSSNLNLLVTRGNVKLVARVYRPSVSVARLTDIQRARRHLNEHGFPCVVPIPASDGNDWVVVGERLLELEPYVDHDGYMNSWKRVRQGLTRLGEMHDVLSSTTVGPDSTAPRFVNYVAPDQVRDATVRGTARIRAWRPTAQEARLADRSDELAQLVVDAERTNAEALSPRQLVHGDFWDNNVLYREEQIVLVHDFDHMGERARIDDLALTLYYMNSEPAAALNIRARRSLMKKSVDAYNSGVRSPLAPSETAALPVALARQPLWSIGGWVAELDDERAARAHAAGMLSAVEFALEIMRNLAQWQEALN